MLLRFNVYYGNNCTGIEIFFTEVDFDLPEDGTSNTITLAKTSNNAGPIQVRVSFFTYEGFDNSGLTEPSTTLPDRPDPAERKYGGV